MPISDKVIEMETKKKGLTAIFIVLIAVLAAASILFAVLWVVKAPAVDPPAVEKISLGVSDLYTESAAGTPAEDIVYKVSPGCRYALNFDIVLKENSSEEDTNPVLTFSYDEKIIMPQASGIDPENRSKYVYEFTVLNNATVGATFQLTVTSAFTPETHTVIKFQVVESYVENFDLVSEDASGLKTIKGFRMVRSVNSNGVTTTTRVEGSTLTLQEKEGSSELRRIYGVQERMVYYETGSGLYDKNETYILSFEQLGKIGVNGNYAKIQRGIDGLGGGKFDQVQVFVAEGWNANDNAYKEIVDGYRAITNPDKEAATKAANLELDLNPDVQYCRDHLYFNASGSAGKCTIKLVANAFNNAVLKPEILIEIEFINSNTIDKITDIKFTSPYTGLESNEIDFYLNGVGGNANNPFVFDEYISVVKGRKTIAHDDFKENDVDINMSVTDENGNVINTATALIRSYPVQNADFAFGVRSSGVGDAYITISDRDPYGFSVSKVITVHVRGRIEDVNMDFSDLTGDSLNVDAGKNISADLTYALHNGQSAKDFLGTLNSSLTIAYPTHANDEGPTLAAPEFGKDGVTNAADTIVVEGMSRDAATSRWRVFPRLTAGTGSTLTSSLTFAVGANVQQGVYEFTFLLASQGLVKSPEGFSYAPENEREFTVRINVTHLASYFRFDDAFDFSSYEYDKYTELEGNTLTIAAGTGNGGFTTFTLADLLQFYYENDDEAAKDINYDRLHITPVESGVSAATVWESRTGRFVVPRENQENVKLQIAMGDGQSGFSEVLTIAYIAPVKELRLTDKTTNTSWEKAQTIYYNAPGSSGMSLNNGTTDTLELVSFSNRVIATTDPAGTPLLNSALIKYPERLQLDIAVMWTGNSTAHILLAKKQIGNSIYYFDPQGFNEDTAEAKDALLRVYSDFTSGYNLTVLKDLFSVSVADMGVNKPNAEGDAKSDRDFQRLVLFYSYYDENVRYYNENIEQSQDSYLFPNGPMFPLNDRHVIQNINDLLTHDLVACTYYNLVRRFDALNVLDSQYNDLTNADRLEYPSGTHFNLFAKGTIYLSDGVTHNGGNTYVVTQRSGMTYVPTIAHSVFEIRLGNDTDTDRLKWIATDGGYYMVECAPDTPLTRYGSVRIAEAGKFDEAGWQHQDFSVYSFNQAVKIKSISINSVRVGSGNSMTVGGTPIVLYKNGAQGSGTIVLYYEIVFENPENNPTLDSFRLAEGYSVAFSRGDANPNVSAGDLTAENNYTFRSFVELSVLPSAPNDIYTLEIHAGSSTDSEGRRVAASVDVRVSTQVESDVLSATVRVGNTDQTVGVYDEDADNPPVYLKYVKADAANAVAENTYRFVFDFNISSDLHVDTSLLSYRATALTGATGCFYSRTQEYANADTVKGADILGYKLVLNGARNEGQNLTITVIQTLPGETTPTVYELVVQIIIDVPVTDLKMKITPAAGNAVTLQNGGAFQITTDGRTATNTDADWVVYSLDAIINESGEKPLTENYDFYLEDATKFSDVYRVVGKTLSVNYSALSADNATLALKAGDMTIRIGLTLKTSKILIRFKNTSLASGVWQQKDNAALDCAVNLLNAGDPSVTYSHPVEYTYEIVDGTLTVQKSGSVFTPVGSAGTFRVTATYGDLTVSVLITVSVPVSDITLSDAGVTLIKDPTDANHYTRTVTVTALSDVSGVDPDVDDISVSEVGNATVTKAQVSGKTQWILTFTPESSGTSQVTVRIGNITKQIDVTVLQPQLTAASDAASYNLFANTNSETVDVRITVSLIAGVYKFGASDLPTVQPDGVFSDVTAMLVSHSDTSATYLFRLPKSRVTADMLSGQTIQVTASWTLNVRTEYALVLRAAAAFSLTADGYTPAFDLREGTQSVTLLDKALGDSAYKFLFAPLSTVGTVGITYTATDGNGNAAFTVNSDGTVSGLASAPLGQVSVTMTVSMFGGWTRSVTHTYTVVDSSTISSALYIGTQAGINGNTLVTAADVAIDYNTASGKKVLTLAVDITSVQGVLTNTDMFTVSGATGLTKTGTARFETVGGKKYYTVSYIVDKPGDYSFYVYATVNGKVYEALPIDIELTAVKPVFTMNKSELTLSVGASDTVSVQATGTAVYDEIVYTDETGDSALLTVTQSAANSSEFTVAANANTAGGSVTVWIRATVSGGVYDAYTMLLKVTVTVTNTAKVPVVTATNYQTTVGSADKNLNELFTYQNIAEADVSITYGLILNTGDARGTLSSGGLYSAPLSCPDGVTFDVPYTATVRSGNYANMRIEGTFTITVWPYAGAVNNNNVRFTSSADRVAPGDNVTLSAWVGGSATAPNATLAADSVVSYALSDDDAGYINGNTFVAKQYDGAVTITATVSIVKGAYAGATYTQTKVITVNGLTLAGARLEGNPGSEIELRGKLQSGTTAISGTANTFTIESFDTNTVSADNANAKLRISPDANFGTTEKTVRIKVTVVQNGITFVGEFDVYIAPLAVPELSVEVSSDRLTYTAEDAEFAHYSVNVISGNNLLSGTPAFVGNVLTLTPRTDTAGGTAVVQIVMTVSGGKYAGSIYDGKTFTASYEISVEAANKPSLNVTIDKTNDDGTITVTLVGDNASLYKIESDKIVYTSNSAYITVNADGTYVLNRDNATHTGQTIGITAIVEKRDGVDAPYDEFVLTGTTPEITVGPQVASALTFAPDYANGRITDNRNSISGITVKSVTYSVNSASAAYITLATDGSFVLDYDAITAANVKSISVRVDYVYRRSTAWRDTEDYANVTISVAAAMAELPAPTALQAASGTLTPSFDSDTVKILAYTTDSAYVTIVGNRYTLHPDTTERKASVTVTYQVTSGMWKGSVIEKTFTDTITVPAAVLGSFEARESEATQGETAATFTVAYTQDGYYANAVIRVTADVSSVQVTDRNDGTITVVAPRGKSQYTVTLTVEAIVLDAPFAGTVEKATVQLTVTAVPATLALTLTETSSTDTEVVYTLVYDCNYALTLDADDIQARIEGVDTIGLITVEAGETPNTFTVTARRDTTEDYTFTLHIGKATEEGDRPLAEATTDSQTVTKAVGATE